MTHGFPGRIVVIEGPDGCGKDTQIDLVVKALMLLHPERKIAQTHEPGT
jgi:thymidylate kinase